MRQRAFVVAFALLLLLLALLGWTADGLRWAFTGSRRRLAAA